MDTLAKVTVLPDQQHRLHQLADQPTTVSSMRVRHDGSLLVSYRDGWIEPLGVLPWEHSWMFGTLIDIRVYEIRYEKGLDGQQRPALYLHLRATPAGDDAERDLEGQQQCLVPARGDR